MSSKRLSEREQALALAKKLMDDTDSHPGIDPDDDLRLLSRQLLRGQEIIDQMHKNLQEVDWNGMAERALINANRDQIFEKHKEAIRRVSNLLDRVGGLTTEAATKHLVGTARLVIRSLNLFHPMHTESWCGWPKESD